MSDKLTRGEIRELGTSIKKRSLKLADQQTPWKDRLNDAKQARWFLDVYIANIAAAHEDEK